MAVLLKCEVSAGSSLALLPYKCYTSLNESHFYFPLKSLYDPEESSQSLHEKGLLVLHFMTLNEGLTST